MKKLIALLLCGIAVLCLYACTPKDETTGASGTVATTAPTQATNSTTLPPVTTQPTIPPVTQPTTRPVIPTEPNTQPTAPPEPTTQPTEPHVHSFGPWIMIQRASCTRPEISTHICTCGSTEQKITGQIINHSYDDGGACTVCGRQVSAGLAYQLNGDGKSYTLISRHDCRDENIIIPEIYGGLPVTAIGYAAFSSEDILSVELPDSILTVADSAFQNCYRLSSVKLSKGLRSIGNWAFSGTALTEIYLPENMVFIGREAFHHCESLRNISVDPYNVAFEDLDGVLYKQDMTGLLVYPAGREAESYLVPEGVSHIADYAFLGCFRIKQIQLPEGLQSIGESAFAGSGIRAISLPAAVSTIGSGAFGTDREYGLPGYGGCDYLAEILVHEGNPYFKSADGVLLSKDGRRLLVYPAGKTGTGYTVPSGVTQIGDSAFVGCTRLTELILSEGVTTVGNSAFGAGFYKYNNLQSITIPESVTQLGDYALAFCDKLTDIHYSGTLAQWMAVTKGQDWDLRTGEYTLHYRQPEPTIPDPSEPGGPDEPTVPTQPEKEISFRVRVVDQYGAPVENVWIQIALNARFMRKTDENGCAIWYADKVPFEDGYHYVPILFDNPADAAAFEPLPDFLDESSWYYFDPGSGEAVIVLMRK